MVINTFFVLVTLLLFISLPGCIEKHPADYTVFSEPGFNLVSGLAAPPFGQVNVQQFGFVEHGIVVRCIDGDTLVLENNERVRLIGVDTPEKGQACFEEAKKRLEELVLGKRVLLVMDVSDRDKYGRLVRFVYVDGLFVNPVLVEEGLALALDFEPDTSLASVFHSAEARASKGNGCLWVKSQS